MSVSWEPSLAGRIFTWAKKWSLRLEDGHVHVEGAQHSKHHSVVELPLFDVKLGWLWATVRIQELDGTHIELKGLSNEAARRLSTSVTLSRANHFLGVMETWYASIRSSSKTELERRGWLSFEFKQRLNATKPKISLSLFKEPIVAAHLEKQSDDARNALAFWRSDLPQRLEELNRYFEAKQLLSSKEFFDQIEKSPLTEEQAKAVICFDNRVQLVASAGSGKTSTMVAKAAYALKQRYFTADKTLLLAFNRDAAKELRTRLQERLAAAGMSSDGLVAKTFHAFGLEVIGDATGKKPSLAPWIENDIDAMQDMVDDLRDIDGNFRTNWDMFRLVLAQDLPKFGQEQKDGDSWDRENRRTGFWTLNNETVKSRGEQLLANWLFYNGVRYQYERPYPHPTADKKHTQYHPDFYLPDIDSYLEHWAVDAEGNPPAEFHGYRDGMTWKKALHRKHKTRLLETTMASLWSGHAFSSLSKELTALGIVLDPNPDREVPGRKPIENPRLLGTFRSFLTHVKSNRLTLPDLRSRLETGVAGHFRYRHDMFLRLFEALWNSWEGKLRAEGSIDFEDMLGMAADCIEQGQWKSPYELVMVDEFQDSSQARARLVRSLLAAPDKYLFAVGDDWQSINRFAGADLEVMTGFNKTFEGAVTLRLENTFRCPQSLCDISSAFVQKNPKQLRKAVRSTKPDVTSPISIVQVAREEEIRTAVQSRIREIASTHDQKGDDIKIYVLGRYRRDAVYLPAGLSRPGVEVKFVTAHGSKGLEADHVIVPRMTAETLGFPSQVEDDPVLHLAMPGGDDFEHAEERRLFYVTLTRARSTVTLITVAHKESLFVMELIREHKIEMTSSNDESNHAQLCEVCGKGFLVPRNSRYGQFLGCTNFPPCTNKRRV